MKDLDLPEPVRRYQRQTPGERIHLDIKKLGKFDKAGHRMSADRTVKSRKAVWEFVHVCIDWPSAGSCPTRRKRATNGKAERFIQTSLREWAYAKAYPTSDDRAAQLPVWLHRNNWHRPHCEIDDATPISRIGWERNNLLRLHS
jgi:hypothetical protein